MFRRVENDAVAEMYDLYRRWQDTSDTDDAPGAPSWWESLRALFVRGSAAQSPLLNQAAARQHCEIDVQ